MIVDFRCEETEKLFRGEELGGKFPPDILRPALRKLLMVNAATNVSDLRHPPGNRLERLTGDRAGQYSIRINDQWRVCFVWQAGDAYQVEIVDYH